MSSSKERIYLSSPHMTGNEIQYIEEAFRSNWVAPLGPNVDAFEMELSEKVGCGNALALSSGTSAIHLALRYLGVNQGDIVFCSSFTFAASCNPILYQGAEPVFIDSEPDSWNMSANALERALTEHKKNGKLPKALVVTNLYGQSADLDPILELAHQFSVPVVEDAAESLGAKYKGKASGTFGYFGIYSFNGNKIITTSGGGMLVSNDSQAIEKCRFWSTQARDKARYYQHSEYGYNYRMSNVLAGIGRAQLKVLEDRVQKRKSINERYKEELAEIREISFMPIPSFSQPNYWLTVLQIDKASTIRPNDIMDTLENENIESRPVWKPMHLQPLYSSCKYYPHNGDGISDDIFYMGVCLPSGSNMSEEQQQRVIDCIKKMFK